MNSTDLWVTVASALVLLMQAGFLCFEVGLARERHRTAVAMKNLIDWALVTLLFSLIGSALMFGPSIGGFVGSGGFFDFASLSSTLGISPYTFLIFQTAFAGTAITIVSGALVERVSFGVYVALSALMAVVIYPVIGHWVWGGQLGGEAVGWLEKLGFSDFAGAGVVHLTGATVAFVGVKAVGPRLGRFRADGSVAPFEASSMSFSALGTVLLWIGWWGFNGGSAFTEPANVGRVIFVTNVAGSTGLISAFLFAWKFGERKELATAMMGGALGGMVAVTAMALDTTVFGAFVLGLAAGPVFVTAARVLLVMKIDDALNVVPVHGACAILGLLFAPLVATTGTFDSTFGQLGIQLVGIVAIIAWAAATSGLFLYVVRRTVGIRLSPSEERGGEAIADTTERDEQPEKLSVNDLADLL